MGAKEILKEKVIHAIDENRDKIIDFAEQIFNKPELGYRENHTTYRVEKELEALGLTVEREVALTGCRATLNNQNRGPRIAVMGELDAVICMEHPNADEFGAVHACGHHMQLAAMLGVAIGLIKGGVSDELAGVVDFFAVPAEEFIELEYRSRLKEQGKIKFFGGKQELIYRGYFDQVDMAMMVHALSMNNTGKNILIGAEGNGFLGKKIQFIGSESHAGAAPEKGINALNAAVLAINNIHAQRETFMEKDRIRVHPILTKGGDIVNAVPADVRMEAYVRGRTLTGILDANHKVNRSLKAGAMAVGATLKINEIPGYLPLLTHQPLDELCHQNAATLIAPEQVAVGGELGGSFDFGDLSHLMPTLHPFIGGVTGELHTREFKVVDKELAYLLPAKLIALTLIDLLYDDARQAREILNNFTPSMTKSEYLKLQQGLSKEIVFTAE